MAGSTETSPAIQRWTLSRRATGSLLIRRTVAVDRGTMVAMPSRRRPAGLLPDRPPGRGRLRAGRRVDHPGLPRRRAPRRRPRRPTDVAAASTVPSGDADQAAQTDTDWGRIWDSLPGGFPRYPGATPSDEAATGPASAVLVVQGADARSVATFYQGALAPVGYTTDGLSGPLEDGGYVLDMTGPTRGCKLQVTVAPTGGLIIAHDPVRGGLPTGVMSRMRNLAGACGATHGSTPCVYPAATLAGRPVRPSLGEARSCNPRIHAISGPSPSWWGCSSSCSSSA